MSFSFPERGKETKTLKQLAGYVAAGKSPSHTFYSPVIFMV
jgi:hypothetical protein